ncbi:CPBP family intramembrane glutamic endopeptidase [Clostridioides difficile]|uniref:CPBP family intramembrane glutamic endopeptidase n=1 Tax=Clostridioides difficile TaxID=1496 RepID=UPI0003B2ACD7|nr:type II CAAX endopeptidase family protein [Clostridioides difficile]AXU51845.1 CAAX-like membrane endopeptidase [Clostridioides difficile]MBS4863386.1 CPBP family intramembrane metalloprotease [Clostridioides difficile]MCI4264235.1 CPBP family intramembrane metalloprotease [Clostridioides difficile]MCK1951482.1 CPBP family intramembrane metalloprotease [Clostridioides difficile]MCU6000800.1 CPBP family intramembrane metalloprotease [Clostridioides difficile]
MGTEKSLKRPVASFIILTNIIFLPLFLLVVVTIILKLPTVISDIALCISAWSSTFAFMILFKKIYPGKKFLVHVKDRFRNKLKFSTVSIIISIQVLIAVVVIFILASKNHGIMPNFTVSSWGAFIYLFLKNLFAGPLGEELGWTGFVQNELQKKYSPLKSAIIVGFWWGMWHLPIWFTTGFTGIDLIKYIIFFMIAIISTTIIVATFYNLNKTLLISVIIHQLFNFLIGIISGSLIELIKYYAMLYLIFAIALIAINPGNVLYKNIRE